MYTHPYSAVSSMDSFFCSYLPSITFPPCPLKPLYHDKQNCLHLCHSEYKSVVLRPTTVTSTKSLLEMQILQSQTFLILDQNLQFLKPQWLVWNIKVWKLLAYILYLFTELAYLFALMETSFFLEDIATLRTPISGSPLLYRPLILSQPMYLAVSQVGMQSAPQCHF